MVFAVSPVFSMFSMSPAKPKPAWRGPVPGNLPESSPLGGWPELLNEKRSSGHPVGSGWRQRVGVQFLVVWCKENGKMSECFRMF